MKIIDILYNSQKNNDSWGGKLQPWAQCFYTSVVMLLSRYIAAFTAEPKVLEYIDDVEVLVGKPGIGESIMSRDHLSGRSGQYWVVHQAAIDKYMKAAGISGKCVFGPTSVEKIKQCIDNGDPVVIGTTFGSGHVILLSGYDESNWYAEDPYGVGPGYSNPNGHRVQYPFTMLAKYTEPVTKQAGKMLAMYWQA